MSNNETVKETAKKTATPKKAASPAATAELTFEQKREASLALLGNVRRVEGFYPETLLQKFPRGEEEVVILPAQVRRLWFRLWCDVKNANGRIEVKVKSLGNNMFVANATVYINGEPVGEGEAFKMLTDPLYSPRETSQTQAINLALRNGGFEVYGEKMPEVVSSDDVTDESSTDTSALDVVVDEDGVVEGAETNGESNPNGSVKTTDPVQKKPAEKTKKAASDPVAEPADAIPFVHSAEEITEELANRALNVHWQVKSNNRTAHYNGMLLSAILQEEEGAKLIMWGAEKAREDEYYEIARACLVLQILYNLRK